MKQKRILRHAGVLLLLALLLALGGIPVGAAPDYKAAYAELLKQTSVEYPGRYQDENDAYQSEMLEINPSKMRYLLLDINQDKTPELLLVESYKGEDFALTSLYIYTCTAKGRAVPCTFKKTRYNGTSGPVCFDSYVKGILYSKKEKSLVFDRRIFRNDETGSFSKRIYSLIGLTGKTLIFNRELTYRFSRRGRGYYRRNLKTGRVVSVAKSVFTKSLKTFRAIKTQKATPLLNTKKNRTKSFGKELA